MTTSTAQPGSAPAKPPLVISGPSGCGKSTLLNKLFAKYPDALGFSVSHTSRAPRKGDVAGESYHFVSRPEFEALRDADGFIETAEFSGNLYGTSRAAVGAVAERGRICVLDIEINGVRAIRAADLGAHFVLIRPPSMAVLEQRLRGRASDSDEAISRRLDAARRDLAEADAARPPLFDAVVVNEDLEAAFSELEGHLLRFYGGLG